ncbi:hypothetical protein GCK32_007933 [Trichostrongylus colubriformis]|uniref:Uncharacterized protein n=1 Tax=Trichostrongylus colubriformis TaxID=6319 RepID=A0AAN8IF27_TRICO
MQTSIALILSSSLTRISMRSIAATNNMASGRNHAFDIQSDEIRINEASEEDGIRQYVHAIDETGDGFWVLNALMTAVFYATQQWRTSHRTWALHRCIVQS